MKEILALIPLKAFDDPVTQSSCMFQLLQEEYVVSVGPRWVVVEVLLLVDDARNPKCVGLGSYRQHQLPSRTKSRNDVSSNVAIIIVKKRYLRHDMMR